MKIIADLHTHTRYSHGKGTVKANVTVALARGLQAVAITDHGPCSAPWVGTSLRGFAAMAREVAEIDRRSPAIRVFAGVECNIISLQGDLDLPEAHRNRLDIVLAGLHPGVRLASGRDWLTLSGANWAARFTPGLRRRTRIANTQAVVAAVYRNQIDVITHPGYHLDIDTAELARACAQCDTAMEINARHNAMTAAFCQVAAREGVRFVINSDAHQPGDVGNLQRGIDVAAAAGLDPGQVLNSDQGGLFDWLEAKRARRSQSTWADWAEQPPLHHERKPAVPEETERQKEARGKGSTPWADWSDQGEIH